MKKPTQQGRKRKRKFGFREQLFAGFIEAILLTLVSDRTGIPLIFSLGWSLMGLAFVVNPVLPEHSRWKESTGRTLVRIFGLVVIATAWIVPREMGLY